MKKITQPPLLLPLSSILALAALAWTLLIWERPPFLIEENLPRLLFPILVVLLMLCSAVALGSAALRLLGLGNLPPAERGVLIPTLGLGVMAHAMLLLGMFGGYRKTLLAILVIVPLLLGLRSVIGFWAYMWDRMVRGLRMPAGAAANLAVAAVVVVLLFACLVAYAPPTDYDVLEYHLAVPRDLLETRAWVAFPYNFYANLPFEIEMLFTLALSLGGAFGTESARMVVFALLVGNLTLLWQALSVMQVRRRLRPLALLLFALHPTVVFAWSDAFNDLGASLFAGAGFLAWLLWVQGGPKRCLLLASVFVGLACCCKYPAVGIVAIPFALALIPGGLLLRREGVGEIERIAGRRTRPFGVALAGYEFAFALTVALVFLPWALKDYWKMGNPVYPFLSQFFPTQTWSAAQSEFLLRVHGSVAPFSAEHLRAMATRIAVIGPLYALPLLALLLPGGGRRARGGRWGVAFLALGYFIWNLVTHSPDRFMTPWIWASAAIWGLLLERLWLARIGRRWLYSGVVALVAAYACWGGYQLLARLEKMGFVPGQFSESTRAAHMDKNLYPLSRAIEFANTHLSATDGVLMLYEARAFLLRIPHKVNTPHDASVLLEFARRCKDGDELRRALAREGITHVLVNERELARTISFFAPRERLDALGLDPVADFARLAAHPELYPPYLLAPDYAEQSPKIAALLRYLDGRMIYHDETGGLRLYIAAL